MGFQCSVCKDVKRKGSLTFLDPIDDWICDTCLEEGRKEGVSNLEEGRELTERIREGDEK